MIDPEKALELIKETGKLEGLHVAGRLHILRLDFVRFPIELRNCVFDDYYGYGLCYEEEVIWKGCTFTKIDFDASYFPKGLTCKGCEFLEEVNYTCGGHNDLDHPILFENVIFHKFVDFFDCHFMGPVIFRDVRFLEGTNLLNEEWGCVFFISHSVMEGVVGQVDVARGTSGGSGPRHPSPEEYQRIIEEKSNEKKKSWLSRLLRK